MKPKLNFEDCFRCIMYHSQIKPSLILKWDSPDAVVVETPIVSHGDLIKKTGSESTLGTQQTIGGTSGLGSNVELTLHQ